MGHHLRVLAIAVVVVAVMAAVMPADSAEASGGATHCVRPGETLFSIGRMYGVSPWTIAYANGLANPNFIVAGQCLTIPSGHGHGHGHGHQGGYKFQPGRCDTHPQCCYPKPPSWCYPPVQPPVVQPPIYVPPPSGFTYCVKPCDTLFSIGRMFGVSPWAIASANGIANPNYIRAGQCLTIPR